MGARLRCASPTIRTICANKVPAPTRSARINIEPVLFTVAPISAAPGCFSTGIDSPVTIDSSTALLPSSTTPSMGTFSPGRTRRRSPTTKASSGTSVSVPSAATRRAVLGARCSKALMAALVWPRALSSNTCPNNTNTAITAAASKYTATTPSASLKVGGKICGNTMAITL